MNLKVLPLDTWMTFVYIFPEEFQSCVRNMEKILPIFNRNGIYKYGNLCWFETEGVAYKYHNSQFDYEMNVLHASEINYHQAKALHDIIQQKLSNKKQRDLYRYWKDSVDLNMIGRGYHKRAPIYYKF